MTEKASLSISDRIAALQLDKVHAGRPPIVSKPPVKPPLPSRPLRTTSSSVIVQSQESEQCNLPNGREYPPALLVVKSPPSLPPRLPSRNPPYKPLKVDEHPGITTRSSSVSSTASALSRVSSASTAPTSRNSSFDARAVNVPAIPRRTTNETKDTPRSVDIQQSAVANTTDNTVARKSALLQGFGGTKAPSRPLKPPIKLNNSPPPISSRPSPQECLPRASQQQTPPPIPLHSRPTLPTTVSDSVAVPSKPLHSSPPSLQPSSICLICRDFSAADAHAARFPRQSIPSTDAAWLAYELTSPFPSLTDKARALFTWLHHNVAYDTACFFSGNLKAAVVSEVITSGLAVCEGYARLFHTLALHAGLECVVIGGASKGFGFSPPEPNTPLPPFKTTHAWNAVKLDSGQWKLIDACWGAGTVDGASRSYKKGFNPRCFTMSNNDFGLRHYPEDPSLLFRDDGLAYPYEAYILGPDGLGADVVVFGECGRACGFSETRVLPRKKHIAVRGGGTVRFQFQSVCEHWHGARRGRVRPYVILLCVKGVDGRKDEHLPFQTNGKAWWVDVPARELGAPGQTISAMFVKTMGEREGGGVSVQEYKAAKGKMGMSFGGVAAWELV